MPCTSSTLVAPTVVEDAAGALLLAQAVNCSGGDFDVSWVGSVTVAETIRVSDGTVLSVEGTAHGNSSFVDGAGEVSLFYADGGTLRLSDLSLVDGVGENGAAIHVVDSELTLERCTFSGNNASSSGGAVYSADSKLTLDHCTFSENTAVDGGAILAYTSSSFITTGSSDVALNRCMFSNNHATRPEEATSTSLTGRGGAICATEVVLTSNSSQFSGNTGNRGGAIWTYGSQFSSDNCTFSDNYATDNGGVIDADELIWTSDSCTFSNNECGGVGGAIRGVLLALHLSSRSVFRANRAGSYGGAISIEAGFNISVQGDAAFEDNFAAGNGGGVSAIDSELHVLAGGSATFTNNRANSSGGGISLVASSVFVDGQLSLTGNSAGSGGGMYVTASSGLEIGGILFSSNHADTAGGAMSCLSLGEDLDRAIVSSCLFYDNGADDGGAVFIAGGFVDIIGSNFDGNVAGKNQTCLVQKRFHLR